MTTRILIADDEPAIRQLLEVVLVSQGYEVIMAANGDELVRLAQERMPDLLLIDLMMPYIDGYEAIRQLRNDTRTAHLPMIVLTAKGAPDDVVTGFETGADDYITKPFNHSELLARIKGHLRRASQRPVLNPLTGLKGSVLLSEELKFRLRRQQPFALLYLDLDNFKAFNDFYGPARGDRVIKLLAEVAQHAVNQYGVPSDFVGHIGGDDFAVVTAPECVDELCKRIISEFDTRIVSLYDKVDRERGYLTGVDRYGVPRVFPIISVSIGVASSLHRQFADEDEVSRAATEMKKYAKQHVGSSFAVDKRANHYPVGEERRGAPLPVVLVLSPDERLRELLHQGLADPLCRVLDASDIPSANQLLAREPETTLIVADARLGEVFWGFLGALAQTPHPPAVLLIATRMEDAQLGAQYGARAVLQQPFRLDELTALATPLLRRQGEAPYDPA